MHWCGALGSSIGKDWHLCFLINWWATLVNLQCLLSSHSSSENWVCWEQLCLSSFSGSKIGFSERQTLWMRILKNDVFLSAKAKTALISKSGQPNWKVNEDQSAWHNKSLFCFSLEAREYYFLESASHCAASSEWARPMCAIPIGLLFDRWLNPHHGKQSPCFHQMVVFSQVRSSNFRSFWRTLLFLHLLSLCPIWLIVSGGKNWIWTSYNSSRKRMKSMKWNFFLPVWSHLRKHHSVIWCPWTGWARL